MSETESVACMFNCLLSGNNKIPGDVRRELTSIMEMLKNGNADGASKFALNSLDNGVLSPYNNTFNKIKDATESQQGGKRRRKTRVKNKKRRNKSVRGGKYNSSKFSPRGPENEPLIVVIFVLVAVWLFNKL